MMIVGMLPLSVIPVLAEDTYPIVINGSATYSDKTYDLSGKSVEHIFEITGSGTVEFNNITFLNVTSSDYGSCVYVNGSDVKVKFQNCRFINCKAKYGDAVYIANVKDGQEIIFSNSYAVNCHADVDGGFMYVNDAGVNVFGSGNTVISDCKADDYGGAIYMNLGMKIDGFILSDNHSDYGGGLIGYEDHAISVENCIVTGTVTVASSADAITGHSVSGSSYEQCFYNKEKSGSSHGIGLSADTLQGIEADTIGDNEYRMPYCVNNYIDENEESTVGWRYAAFDENGLLVFVPEGATMYVGADGLYHYAENAISVTADMTTLGETGKSGAYYVDGNVTSTGRVQILGDVMLILNDGCHYDVQGGFNLEKGNSLTVASYSLGENMGSLTVAATRVGDAAIGGNVGSANYNGEYWLGIDQHHGGTLNVLGGNITVDGQCENSVGIGGGAGANYGFESFFRIFNTMPILSTAATDAP